MEKSICPVCTGNLKVIGSKKRHMIDAGGERVVLVVRRMKCLNGNCGKIHHELPDVLIPYKMHTTIVFEKIIEQDTSEVPVEDSTIARIRAWFYGRADALVGALIGLYATLNRGSGIELSDLPGSILERIHFFVDKSEEWLKRLVRILVNNNKWIHTQLV